MGLQWMLSLMVMAGCVLSLQAEDASVERRAPQMGFMGMRGKKDLYEDKRAPSMGFTAMRGKKDSLFDMSDLYPDYKRAQMGFMGMRGKKEFEPDYDFEWGYDKRAPSMGFAAMRGKKAPTGFLGMKFDKNGQGPLKYDWDATTPDYYLMDDDIMTVENLEKRAPASGFFGMRGKKMPQNSGFFGMRGKKGPSGFVGMRGKRVPASGFMGVRGKKDSSDDLESLLTMLNQGQGERSKRDNFRQYTDSSPGSVSEMEPLKESVSQ